MVCFSFLQNICFQLRITKQWYKFLILFLFSCNTSEHYLLPSHVTRGHQLKGILEFAALRFLPFFRWKKFHIVVFWGQQILTYTLVSIYWLRNIRFVPEQSRPYWIRPRWSTRPVIRLYLQHIQLCGRIKNMLWYWWTVNFSWGDEAYSVAVFKDPDVLICKGQKKNWFEYSSVVNQAL